LLSNSNTQYIIDNNDISVNGTLQFDIHATEALDIRLRDASNNVITPISVTETGNHATIVLPTAAAPVGATLTKTGQQVSYRTGDDGDIEAGRAVDFTKLAAANPFGNINRFTDELGGGTYTNNIVIDWSTYNGSTVLGYKRTPQATAIWGTQVDNCLAVSVGTFTTGWRIGNVTEYVNIVNRSIAFTSGGFNYSPFNISISLFWTGNTLQGSSDNKFYIFNFAMGVNFQGSANSLQAIAVRTFTVTGTTLT
jgi:hypothetical protein